MSINSCYTDISRYNTMKNNIYNIINSLNNASNSLSPVAGNVYSAYNFNDGDMPIVNRCNKLNNDIVNTSNFLKYTVIPAIDAAINAKHQSIIKMQEEQSKADREKKNNERTGK